MLLTPNKPDEPRWGFFLFSSGFYGIIVVTVWTLSSTHSAPAAPKATNTAVLRSKVLLTFTPDATHPPANDVPPAPPAPVAQAATVHVAVQRLTGVHAIRLPLPADDHEVEVSGRGAPPPIPKPIIQPSLPKHVQEVPVAVNAVLKNEDIQPPVITYEPNVPKQTRGVHGEVVLLVAFRADGGIEVLRVVHSLGPAQDAEARRIALGMRFEPAHTDSGRAVDYEQQLHITFG